jgi:hypothetical protein
MASIINSTTTSPGGLISTGDSSNSLLIQTGDTTAITVNSTQAVALANNLTVAGTTTHTGVVTNSTYANIDALLELCTITAAAPSSTTNYDVITQAVQYYTSNAANNWTLNIRGNSGTTLNSIMAIGQAVTVALITTQGGTAYYASALQVDGNAVTPKYQGGTAWTGGNINGLDVYSYTIIKTANATFTALASQTQFK